LLEWKTKRRAHPFDDLLGRAQLSDFFEEFCLCRGDPLGLPLRFDVPPVRN
jgi:hypothetical protein